MAPSSPPEPRVLLAPNDGPFTLDGTRTYLVGVDVVAVVDPGPDDALHRDAVAEAVAGAREIRILLTHHHGDHAGGARALAERLAAPVLGPPPPEGKEGTAEVELLEPGASVPTDHGELVTVPTPGHSRDHLSFHWPRGGAVFVGDLLLGRGNTTWVGEYPGCVADYLASLERVVALGPAVLYPGHGPALRDVAGAVEAYRRHRLERVEEVRRLRDRLPHASAEELAEAVYGGVVPAELRRAAVRSVEAILAHLAPDA